MPKDPREELPPGCHVEDRDVALARASIRLRSYRPEREPETLRAGLVFFHGGGFVAGDPASHDALCGRVCLAADCVIVSCGYRLAPAHRFPVAVDDAYFAASFVHEQADEFGIDHRRLGVAGVEVGAGLATTVARLAKERRNPALGLQVLIAPRIDLRSAMVEDYASAAECEDPRCSPIVARNLIGVPPVFIARGPDAQADAYAERLREAQVAVTVWGERGRATAPEPDDELVRELGRVVTSLLGPG